jgi:phospholipase C
MRASCSFAAGAMPNDTLGLTEAARKALPIKHVIVMMKENRSFDHLLGQLSTSGQPDAEPVPAGFSNPDPMGAPVARYHETTTCDKADPPHQWDDMHTQWDDGKMNGFVKSGVNSSPATDGHFTMGYYDASDLPFYYWLANTFALADHNFPSVLSGTWANRDYLVAGTSRGIKNTLTDPQLSGVPLIFDSLDAAKVSWDIFTNDAGPLEFSVAWGDRKNWKGDTDLLAALSSGTLPAVSFVDATGVVRPELDEHPPADVQAGEGWTRMMIDALIKSPVWPETVLFFTYDEAGGFADHVPPPTSCVASADQSEFTQLGVRVPLVAVSPWARRHFVSHSVHQHTSILRFIELVFNLPALTARDANSDALLDLFDFSGCVNTTPVGEPPAAGAGRCM